MLDEIQILILTLTYGITYSNYSYAASDRVQLAKKVQTIYFKSYFFKGFLRFNTDTDHLRG